MLLITLDLTLDFTQKIKVGSSFSDLLDILYGVPQGSILGPLLFNISLCDLFLSEYSSEFCNLADDTTSYKCGKNYDYVINKLKIQWENYLAGFSVPILRQMHLNVIFSSHHINQLR